MPTSSPCRPDPEGAGVQAGRAEHYLVLITVSRKPKTLLIKTIQIIREFNKVDIK